MSDWIEWLTPLLIGMVSFWLGVSMIALRSWLRAHRRPAPPELENSKTYRWYAGNMDWLLRTRVRTVLVGSCYIALGLICIAAGLVRLAA
jgi:hypothetical protein